MPEIPLVDVHFHITEYKPHEIPGILSRLESMKLVVSSGITPTDNVKTLSLMSNLKNALVTFGLNPVSVGKDPSLFDSYLDVLNEHRDEVAGIGEVGIDYYWESDEFNRKVQKEMFNRFIDLANELRKPLVIHTRSAMKDTLDILEKNTPHAFFIHSFRGSVSQARRVVELGGYVSLSTAMVRFPRDYTKLINNIPLEYILTETDAPYLSPVKGETNYPWNVSQSLEMMSRVLDQDIHDVADVIYRNALSVFGVR